MDRNYYKLIADDNKRIIKQELINNKKNINPEVSDNRKKYFIYMPISKQPQTLNIYGMPVINENENDSNRKEIVEQDLLSKQKNYWITVNKIHIPINKIHPTTNVFLINGTTAAVAYNIAIKLNCIPVIHSFANSHHVCGKYIFGENGQEESLCRAIPGLYLAIEHEKKLHNFPFQWNKHILYTLRLVLLRDELKQLHTYKNPVYVDVISAAPPDLVSNKHKRPPPPGAYLSVLQTVFTAPILLGKKDRTLILGAWGCNTFKNNSYEIADITMRVITNYGGYYENIVIAIPRSNNNNYEIFKKYLNQYKINFKKFKI